MATNINQVSTLTDAPAANVKTPLFNADTAQVPPQPITMKESDCSSYAKAAAERTAFGGLGAGAGAAFGYIACGTPSMVAAISAGLCCLFAPKAASSCNDKVNPSFLLPLSPKK